MIKNIRCSCGKVTTLDLPEEGFIKIANGCKVRNAFPGQHIMVHETLISGMCFDCQSKLFNIPKPGEDWGEAQGECPACGCTLYAKDLKDGHSHCPSCHQEYPIKEVINQWD